MTWVRWVWWRLNSRLRRRSAQGDFWLRKAHRTASREDYLECVRRSALLGHPSGMVAYGRSYESTGHGHGATEACGWYQKAALAGDPEGASRLARAYELGYGCPRSSTASMQWRQRAEALGWRQSLAPVERMGCCAEAEKASVESQGLDSGGCIRRAFLCMDRHLGPVFERHAGKAWFSILFWAVMAGSVEIAAVGIFGIFSGRMTFLAIVLGTILGAFAMRVDFHWTRRSAALEARAAKGDASACRALGIMYRDGAPGVPQCREVARQWVLRGAEGGDAEAMFILAEMLRWGIGGTKDLEGAQQWEDRAIATPAKMTSAERSSGLMR